MQQEEVVQQFQLVNTQLSELVLQEDEDRQRDVKKKGTRQKGQRGTPHFFHLLFVLFSLWVWVPNGNVRMTSQTHVIHPKCDQHTCFSQQ